MRICHFCKHHIKPGAAVCPNCSQIVGTTDYPYIRAWHRMMGAFGYYTEMMLMHARRDRAPTNAIYRDRNGRWRTFDDITRQDMRDLIIRLLPKEPQE